MKNIKIFSENSKRLYVFWNRKDSDLREVTEKEIRLLVHQEVGQEVLKNVDMSTFWENISLGISEGYNRGAVFGLPMEKDESKLILTSREALAIASLSKDFNQHFFCVKVENVDFRLKKLHSFINDFSSFINCDFRSQPWTSDLKRMFINRNVGDGNKFSLPTFLKKVNEKLPDGEYQLAEKVTVSWRGQTVTNFNTVNVIDGVGFWKRRLWISHNLHDNQLVTFKVPKGTLCYEETP